ncbi:LETM1 domain-containing protein [Phanerochaete sordida]|uniref:LETM1 domain-containing protein n=1 Tax=Phanerochaete sordida TaxID=48140 RepID=A0A9P3GL33_9APHY|nr:LETM1 domain-containing protein [Phanerochaete sordida]
MIPVLRRDGFAASVSMTSKRASALYNAPRRPLSYSVVLSSPTHSTALRLRPGFASPYSHRCYSTPVPPTEKSTGPDGALPVAPRSKKPKVELHPAPVRPKAAPGPSAPKAEKAPEGAAPAASSSSAPAEGLITQTKHDVEAAAQHGILAPPPADAGRIAKLWHQAKELFKFYVRGLKLINTNRKRANAMRERVQNGGPPLSRWETRFIRTYKEDALKLIPFALIIIIAEEAIPLVVMYAPFILPSTCILPSQKERIAAKKRAKQAASAETMAPIFEEIRQRGSADPAASTASLLPSSTDLVAIGSLLGHSSYGWGSLRIRRIQRHLLQVAEDDALLLNEDMGKALTQMELQEALEERGILTDGLSSTQLQGRLQWWLTHVSKPSPAADPVARRIVLVASSGAGRF